MPRPSITWLVACVALAAAGEGCSSCTRARTAAASSDDLSLAPKETNFLGSLDLKKLRGTSLWKRFLDTTEQSAEQKARYADFVQQTGLDPLKQIDSLFLALPQAQTGGEFLAVLRGGPFDEQKLIAFMKNEVKKDGGEVSESEYGGRKRYSDSRGAGTFAVFLDRSTLALASDAWSKKVIDLAARPARGENVQRNEALAALVKKIHTGDAFWGAGLVSPEARERLGRNPDLKAAGSMKDVYGSADFVSGLRLGAVVDLGSDTDARELTDRLKEQIAQSRTNPQVQLMGLGHYFDGVKVASQGAALSLDVKLDQAGVDDLIDRVSGLMKNFGGGLGGSGSPGMPMPPPGAPPGPPGFPDVNRNGAPAPPMPPPVMPEKSPPGRGAQKR